MELGLGRLAVALKDGASPPSAAAVRDAIRTRCAADIGFTGGDVVAVVESVNRAGNFAGGSAAGARVFALCRSDFFGQQDCPAERGKEAACVVDKEPNRRRKEAPCVQCPSVKRMICCATEWKKRLARKCFSERRQNAHRPAVEWVCFPIIIFAGLGEMAPEQRFVRSDQHECSAFMLKVPERH